MCDAGERKKSEKMTVDDGTFFSFVLTKAAQSERRKMNNTLLSEVGYLELSSMVLLYRLVR